MPDTSPRPSLHRQDGSFFATARRRFKGQERWKQILEVTATVCTILGLPIAIIVPILLESPAPAPAPSPAPPASDSGSSSAQQPAIEQLKCGASALGSTVGSAVEENLSSCGDALVPEGTETRGRWFALVGSGSDVSVSTCNSFYSGSSYDTRLRVYREGEGDGGGGDGGRICVAGNDDDSSCDYGGSLSSVSFVAEAGVTYLVLVDGRQPEGGDFVLAVKCSEKQVIDESGSDSSPQPTVEPTERTLPAVSRSPTAAPTTQTLLSILSSNSQDGGAALRTEGTPQRMAYEWLAQDPSIVETYGFVKLFERYSLAVLYYSTNGQQWWDSDNWLNDYSHCSWYGVQCNYINNVERLDLQDNRLEGTISPEIWMLTNIFNLWIPDNDGITGTITTHIGRLKNLVSISLGSNSLEGVVPTELGNLINLEDLRLSNNKLNGKIPTELGNLKKLDTLYLFGNELTGTMPAGICSLRRDGKLASLMVDCTSNILCDRDCCTFC